MRSSRGVVNREELCTAEVEGGRSVGGGWGASDAATVDVLDVVRGDEVNMSNRLGDREVVSVG